MARGLLNRPSPLEVPPSASSSEVEATDSESEQPDNTITTVVVTPTTHAKKPPQPSPSSKPTRSPSPSEINKGATTVHDVNPPMQQEPPKTRARSAASPSPVKSGTKRPADVEVKKEASKKAKKKVEKKKAKEEAEDDDNKGKGKEAQEETGDDEENKGKRSLFQRVWSEEEEIKLVRGMEEYVKVKGGRADPVADVDSFYEFVAPLLSVSVNKSQVQDKVRRMRRKYDNIACRKFKPIKDHDWEAYRLMKKVWGDQVPKVEEPKNQEEDQNEGGGVLKGVNEGGGFFKGFNELGGWEGFLNQGMKLVDQAKTAEVNAKWKELHILEVELFIKKTQVMGDQAKLILEALKSSDN